MFSNGVWVFSGVVVLRRVPFLRGVHRVLKVVFRINVLVVLRKDFVVSFTGS